MHTKIKLGFGWLATGLMLLPLGASAQSQQQIQGQAGSDSWVGTPSAGTTRTTTSSTQAGGAQRDSVQTSADLANRDTTRSSNAQGRVRNISTRFEDRVGENCQYRGTIRGTVREVDVQGATADNARQVTPDLRIQSELSCQDGSARRTVSATLRGPQYAGEQLAQAIQERARIFTSRNGQVCSYAPRLAYDSGRLASSGIAQSCMNARGGGPNGNVDDQTSPLLRTPSTGAVDTQQDSNSMMMQGSRSAPSRNDLRDNGMQQMPSTGGGPGLPGSDVQQGQPSIDDTVNRNTQQQPMDTTGTGQDIAPDSTRSNPPVRQMK
jgi:hypothetical protein